MAEKANKAARRERVRRDALAMGGVHGYSGTGSHAERSARSRGGRAALRGLESDLREAFKYQVEELRSSDSCWLNRESASTVPHGDRGCETLDPGTRLGDFEIVGKLAGGGMGVVYRARQVSLGRLVALKVLPRPAHENDMAVRRFKAEAQSAARLHHTNIVSVYGSGAERGRFYYAMELIEGPSLDMILRPGLERPEPDTPTAATRRGHHGDGDAGREEPRPHTGRNVDAPSLSDYRQIARLLCEVADALAFAHEHGIIHRDVKPHNLLLGRDGHLHLTDFGLARLGEQPHLTVAGEIMGTPAYLSPEQVRGEPQRIDHRTDIYGLGATLYHLITGHAPFEAHTREATLARICSHEPTAPRRYKRKIPLDLETICLRAIEKDPSRRHPSAAVLAEDLRRFADGRPILSRRLSRAQRALRWIRRNPAPSAMMAATAVAVLLAAGWTWTAHVGRQSEARRLLSAAYEQLAFLDYHDPQRVSAEIERAASLGADASTLDRVRALAALGEMDQATAISHLEGLLQRNPEDLSAWYLLAWAHWREGRQAAALNAYEQAEARGPPATPDAWFFRGLAIHFADPAAAIESYRRASVLRARQHAFYPQAVLHLARARNQQMYRERRLESFTEIREGLRQLIASEMYGAYPYYLLSIAHRLAAEIYAGSQGTRDDSLVEEHYAEALRWARNGQQVEPANDRPITAEAECLESMGRCEEAIEARTRAIAIADRDVKRWEGLHYRWRLYYWVGDYAAALEDLAACATYDPENRFYAYVYPALVLAESGRERAAPDTLRSLAESGAALDVIWAATGLRLLGYAEEAATLLETHAERVDFHSGRSRAQSEQWLRDLYAFCRTGEGLSELIDTAYQTDAPWELWGEAWFHAGAWRLAEQDREAALEAFRQAYRSYDSETRYTYHGKLIWIRMHSDPTWPAWLIGAPAAPDASRASPGDAVGPAGGSSSP